MSKTVLTIATRESPLALWQANWVKKCLENIHPQLQVHLLGMTTQADRMPYISLADMGGKGLFVKELEDALLSGRADIAVHCVKDVPVNLPASLCLPVVLTGEEPWDVFISNNFSSLETLPPGAVVGTSSLRRQSLIHFLRPDVTTRGIRGNVNTRLARLDRGEFDAIILAAAGINRLGLQARITQVFSGDDFLPAVGQGVLGIECREDDAEVIALISPLQNSLTYQRILAERSLCRRLGGSCHVPIASFAEVDAEGIRLRGIVADPDGSTVLRAERRMLHADAETLGIEVADDLLKQGADKILLAITRQNQDKHD
jgi:hydroxymethylbilane synthase